jgi:hypothetical protein
MKWIDNETSCDLCIAQWRNKTNHESVGKKYIIIFVLYNTVNKYMFVSKDQMLLSSS